MKFTLIFLVAALIQVKAATYAQQISIEVKNAPIERVFRLLKEQSPYNFYYDTAILKNAKPVTLRAEQASFEAVLEQCFAGQPFDYVISKNTVVIRARPAKPAAPVHQAEITITGRVYDEKSEPITGATVRVKETGAVAGTAQDGRYSIKAPENGTLQVSYVGYLSQEVPVNRKTSIDIALQPADQTLNDVVITAYGQKQRKIETLGAQSTLNVQELKQPVANITTVLAGRISGLVGVQRSAEPGLDNANLWVRGIATMSNSSPLFLVDGVERAFNNIDPNDIESFSILKDASSTAVYGVRGANGVVLITTKKGAAGRTNINVDLYQGITEFTRVPQVADGVTYMQMANEAEVTRGRNPVYSQTQINKTFTQEDPYLYPNVNWFDQIFDKFGNNTKANVNISGGGEKMTYYVSAGYYNETGLFTTDGLKQYNSEIAFKRYNFTSRLDLNATKTTRIGLGIKGWISNGNYPGTGTSRIFESVFNTYPILYPVSYPNGIEPFTSTGGGLSHPLSLVTNRGFVTTFDNQIMSDINVVQDLGFWLKGLSARVLYSFDASNNNRLARTKSPSTTYARGRDAQGNLIYEPPTSGVDYLNFERSGGGSRQFYLEGAINYNNTFGKHKLGAMVLYNQSDRVSASATSLILSIPYRSLGAVGRATYSYDDRYLAEASFGYNGAENFAPNSRFGFFPSGAIGWIVSNEKFYGGASKVFQYLKFRASYGLVGNSRINIFSDEERNRFTYIDQVGSSGQYWYGRDRGNNIQGLELTRYASDVTWETEKDLNLGLEFRTFKNALSLQVDLFNRDRDNIFLQRGSVPSFVGLVGDLVGNLGRVNSRGVDLTGEFNKNFGSVSVGLRGTYTYNKNKILENDQAIQPYDYLDRRGQAVGQRFGYIADGFYTQAEIDDPTVPRTTGVVQAGDLKFRDLNADGVIDANDYTAIGKNDVPQVVYGFGTTIGYKGFSLGAFFQGVAKVDLYLSRDFMPFRNGSARGSLYSNIDDRWTPENPRQDAFYPRLAYGSDINQNYSSDNSHWLMNGSFLRLKTLDFGYTLPKTWLKDFGVQNMRLYFIGYNLLTISPYKMFDPELGNGTGARYPNITTYSLGLNANF
ncbi:TonB-dependent receptor [Pedobacter yulinensis]|nr:TonB-dependent receptor [Pedobacter yulinensis]